LGTDALTVEGLDAFYGESHVLHDVAFRVGRGRVLGLLGRNGAGKTTCIGSIVGLVRARAGALRLFGETIADLPPEAIAHKGVGLVPQGRRVFASLSVRENLTVTARRGVDGHSAEWSLERAYASFPRLKERERQLAGSLSGGEQQMLAICRALLTNPRLMLLDEPSEGLAPQIVAEVAHVLRELKGQGLSIVLVEQNSKLALDIADDVVILNSGRVAYAASAESVRGNQRLLEQQLGVY
jgi:branched-chain amino acid transport system ATP-binding protein